MNCRASGFCRDEARTMAAWSMGGYQDVRNLGVGAGILERWGQGERQRNQADVGAAGLGELGGLRDVFPEDELLPHAIVESFSAQGRHGGAPIRRMLWVRDGDPANASVGQHGQAAPDVDAGIVRVQSTRRPAAYSVEAAAFGQAGALEPPGIVDVGREEDVERRAILNLREEVAGRTERQPDALPRVLLELRGDRGKRGLQIGRRRDGEALRSERAGAAMRTPQGARFGRGTGRWPDRAQVE